MPQALSYTLSLPVPLLALFPVSLQELSIFLENFSRTIHLNKKWFHFILHSHNFGSREYNEFTSRNICESRKFEEYRSEYSSEYECWSPKYKYLQRNSILGGMFFQLGSRVFVTWPLCPSKIWNTFHILNTEFSHGTSCKPFTGLGLDCGAPPHALNREQFKATQEEPKRLSLSKKCSSPGLVSVCGGEQLASASRNKKI